MTFPEDSLVFSHAGAGPFSPQLMTDGAILSPCCFPNVRISPTGFLTLSLQAAHQYSFQAHEQPHCTHQSMQSAWLGALYCTPDTQSGLFGIAAPTVTPSHVTLVSVCGQLPFSTAMLLPLTILPHPHPLPISTYVVNIIRCDKTLRKF